MERDRQRLGSVDICSFLSGEEPSSGQIAAAQGAKKHPNCVRTRRRASRSPGRKRDRSTEVLYNDVIELE